MGERAISLSKLGAYYLDDDPNLNIEEAHYEEIAIEDIKGKAILNEYSHKQGRGRRIIVHIPREYMINN